MPLTHDRRVVLIALPQSGQEGRGVLGGDLGDGGAPPGRHRRLVPGQIPAVGLEGVIGQAPLDRQVVEVAADRDLSWPEHLGSAVAYFPSGEVATVGVSVR